jgi:hypothetical protein
MTRARDLWAAARAALVPHQRFRADGAKVICNSDGASFVVCRITEPLMYDPAHLAQLLADALDASPDKRGFAHPTPEPRG